MNIIPATVVTTPSGLAIELLGKQIPIAPGHHTTLRGLKRVDVGIRPHALRLVPPGPDRITGRVFLREPLGLEDEVLVETADGTRVKVVTAAGEEFEEGAAVAIDLPSEQMHLFEVSSRMSLGYGTGPDM
jgi:ABC-type Fe3+/spermidine/putrescine transport system ATPase subunit